MRGRSVSQFVRLAAGVAYLAAAAALGAQGTAPVIRTARGDTAIAEGGAPLTAVFAIRNPGADSAIVMPTLTLPRGWRAVSSVVSLSLAPGASDTWLAGVSIPAATAAGTYAVVARIGPTSADTLQVRVVARRALEVVSIAMPSWVLSGDGYEARFLVRNAGNVAAAVHLSAEAGRSTATATPAALELAPGAHATVTVRSSVAAATQSRRTSDDVLVLVASDRDAPDVSSRASARTTVVPRNAGDGDYASLPAIAAVRTGGGAAGVSPLLVAGSGLLADGRTAVDFFLQAPTDQDSPWGFGEREEYRVNLTRGQYTARLGDNVYGRSQLTTTGLMGTGAEFSRTRGELTATAFAQQLRWTPGSPKEQGVDMLYGRDSSRRITSGILFRQGADVGVAVGHVGGSIRTPFGGIAEGEIARSDSAHRGGLALRARVSGDLRGVRYDLGMLRGNDRFAGPVRGTSVSTGTVGYRVSRDIDLTATATSRSWTNSVSSVGRMGQSFSTATLAATWRGSSSLEYGWLARRDEGALFAVDGSQHGLRAAGARQFGVVGVSGSLERGVARENAGAAPTPYALVSLAIRTPVGTRGSVGFSASRSAGRTLTGANGDLLGAGANVQLRLPAGLEFGLTMNAQRATFGMLDSSGAWFSVTDARLDRRVGNGASIGLHARVLQSPVSMGSSNSSAVYLEYRAPFRLPTGRSREPGRATGRVVDAEQARPVPGVLVRVGDQAAVSDADGRVRFAGLDAGLHQVSIDASSTPSGAILVGDLSVDLRSQTSVPAQFAVGVTRGARVIVSVVRADLGAAEPVSGPTAKPGAEFLPLGGVLVALAGARDTIFQVSDERGIVDFGTVAPGSWTAEVRQGGDEAWMEFERSRFEVSVAAGERREVEFRLVPVQRQVKIIDGGTQLKARAVPNIPKPRD